MSGIFSFTNHNEPVMVKVGISAVSTDNALKNVEAEIPGWDFNGAVAAANKAWNDELGKIDIQTDNERARRIFYTCLYHTMFAPSIFNDVNGDYRGADGTVHHGDFVNYTTSLFGTLIGLLIRFPHSFIPPDNATLQLRCSTFVLNRVNYQCGT